MSNIDNYFVVALQLNEENNKNSYLKEANSCYSFRINFCY